jgi:hypothetical protein
MNPDSVMTARPRWHWRMLDDNGLFTLNEAGDRTRDADAARHQPPCRGKPNPAFFDLPRLPIVLLRGIWHVLQ